jgi:hypothetical protein
VAGKDASKQFWKYHNEGILKKYQKQLQVGSLDSKAQAAPPTPPATPPPAAKKEKEVVKPEPVPGTVAPQPGADAKEVAVSEALDQFGDMVPGGDPNWYQSVSDADTTPEKPANIHSVPLTLLQPIARRPPRRSPRMDGKRNHTKHHRMGRG